MEKIKAINVFEGAIEPGKFKRQSTPLINVFYGLKIQLNDVVFIVKEFDRDKDLLTLIIGENYFDVSWSWLESIATVNQHYNKK